MEEKEFDYAGIEEVFEIIERKNFIEFAELIDYIFEDVEHYKGEYLMMIVCDNSYVIVKYLESKKRLYQENEQEEN